MAKRKTGNWVPVCKIAPLTRDLDALLAALPPASQPELVILKGHLIVEQLLRRYIEEQVANPEILQKARLQFSTLLTFAEAMAPRSGTAGAPQVIWASLKRLNELRNTLAHKLDGEPLAVAIKRFVSDFRVLARLASGVYAPDDEQDPNDLLRYVLTGQSGYFAAMVLGQRVRHKIRVHHRKIIRAAKRKTRTKR
jgi:hypothetical protein